MAARDSSGVLETVKNLDLKRYMGRWYEIANVPTRFQPQESTNTTATYALKDDGKTVQVANATRLKSDVEGQVGKPAGINGNAWKRNPDEEDAKYQVRFYVPPFFPVIPVTGDYWVIALDENEYTYAMVGEPRRNNLWVLSRTPVMEESTYAKLMSIAEEKGYDVSRLVKTTHLPLEEEEVVKDATAKDNGMWWLRGMTRLFG